MTADLLKKTSIDKLYTYNSGNAIYISVFKADEKKIRQIIELLENDKKISSIKQADKNTYCINYILPTGMYLSEIPMLKPENAPIHVFTKNYPEDKIKVIFNKTVYNSRDKIQKDNLLFNTLSLDPVAEIWIDIDNNKIIKSIELIGNEVRYKNVPEPLF